MDNLRILKDVLNVISRLALVSKRNSNQVFVMLLIFRNLKRAYLVVNGKVGNRIRCIAEIITKR